MYKMAETYEERGDMSMSGLAAMLTAREQNYYLRLTELTMDEEKGKNIATYAEEQLQLPALTVCAVSSYGVGHRVLTTTALIRGIATEISVYRLPKEEF